MFIECILAVEDISDTLGAVWWLAMHFAVVSGWTWAILVKSDACYDPPSAGE